MRLCRGLTENILIYCESGEQVEQSLGKRGFILDRWRMNDGMSITGWI